MAYIQRWPIFKDGLYSKVAYIQRWPIFKGGLYSKVAYIQRRPIFKGGLNTKVAYIQRWPIFKGGLRENLVECSPSMVRRWIKRSPGMNDKCIIFIFSLTEPTFGFFNDFCNFAVDNNVFFVTFIKFSWLMCLHCFLMLKTIDAINSYEVKHVSEPITKKVCNESPFISSFALF